MAVTVGRLRPCSLLDWKFTVLSHNTIRGAAGAAILNAELLASLGKLEPVAETAARARSTLRSDDCVAAAEQDVAKPEVETKNA